jgi:hypothetical protein
MLREERSMLGYIVRNDSSPQVEIYKSCKELMSEGVFLGMWKSLDNGADHFEFSNGIFDISPNLKDT